MNHEKDIDSYNNDDVFYASDACSNTYTQDEFLDRSSFQAGDKIVFNNDVRVTVYDINSKPIQSGSYQEIVLPEYPGSYPSFNGYVSYFNSFKNGQLYQTSLKADFQTHLQVKETNTSYILSVNKNENPFSKGEYECRWFRAGLGFGYVIDGPDAMTWTIAKSDLAKIDPHDSNIKESIQVSLAIHHKETSTKIISNSVTLKLKEPEKEPTVPEEKPVDPQEPIKPKPEEKPEKPAEEQKPDVKPVEKPTLPPENKKPDLDEKPIQNEISQKFETNDKINSADKDELTSQNESKPAQPKDETVSSTLVQEEKNEDKKENYYLIGIVSVVMIVGVYGIIKFKKNKFS